MKVEILQEPSVEIEVGETETLEGVLDRIAELPEVIAIAENVGKNSYYERFRPENTVYSNRQLRPLAEAFLSDDLAAQDEAEEEWELQLEVDYHETVADKLKDAFDDLAAALTTVERFQYAEDEVKDTLESKLQEICQDAMANADTTTIADRFGDYDKVELSFAIDLDGLGAEDLQVSHNREHQFDPLTADPNAKLMRMFKLFNVHPAAFIEQLIERYGVDPRVPIIDETRKGVDWYVEDANKIAAKWQRFYDVAKDGAPKPGSTDNLDKWEKGDLDRMIEIARTVHDTRRPQALSFDDLFLVMTEASYGGTPVYTARYPIKDIIKGKLREPFLAKGGFVGIHNFSNGSGYVDIAKTDILINPAVGGFITNSIDGTYDMVGSYYNNTVTQLAQADADWVQVDVEIWRSEPKGDARHYAQIDVQPYAGDFVFLLSTADKTGAASGRYAESEVFEDLGAAKEAGLKAISMTPEELEAEMAASPKI